MSPRPPSREEIRNLRAALGLSQAALANALGVSPQAVESWEQRDPAKRKAPAGYLRLALRALAGEHGLELAAKRLKDRTWSVVCSRPDAVPLNITGFASEAEAQAWIRGVRFEAA